MAEETKQVTQPVDETPHGAAVTPDETPHSVDEQGDGEQVDYEAKYRELKTQANKWERRARENAKKAKAFDELQEQSMSETEKLQKQLDDANKQLSQIERERERERWNVNVSKATGVPTAILAIIAADDEDELRERAEAIAATYPAQQAEPTKVPVVLGEGKHPDVVGPGQKADFIRDEFRRLRR